MSEPAKKKKETENSSTTIEESESDDIDDEFTMLGNTNNITKSKTISDFAGSHETEQRTGSKGTQSSLIENKTPSAKKNESSDEQMLFSQKNEILKAVDPILSTFEKDYSSLFMRFKDDLTEKFASFFSDEVSKEFLNDLDEKFEESQERIFGKSSYIISFIERETINKMKNIAHRNSLVEELVKTESTYVANINTLISKFFLPLHNMANSPNSFITSNEVRTLFQGIQSICSANELLLSEFQKRLKDWNSNSLIGDAFLSFIPMIRFYIPYVNNYDEAIKVLGGLNQNTKFKTWLKSVESSQCRLDSLLIVPVQRIPRYKLFLTDLLKFTDQSHPDYENLEKALSSLSIEAQRINREKAEAEMREKLISLSSQLNVKDLVQASRRYVSDGPVVSEDKGSGTLFVFNDLLLFAPDRGNTELFRMRLSNSAEVIKGSESDKSDVSFSMYFSMRKPPAVFICTNTGERNNWVTTLSTVVSEFKQQSTRTLDIDSDSESVVVPSVTGELKSLVDEYSQIVALQEDLLKMPIDLKTLFPQFYVQLPPEYTKDLKTRIKALSLKLSSIEKHHKKAVSILKDNSFCYLMDKAVRNGHQHILRLRNTLLSHFPQQEKEQSPTKEALLIIQWYLELNYFWESMKTKK